MLYLSTILCLYACVISHLIPVSRMRGDKIPTEFIFGSNYMVETPSREEWINNRVRLDDDVVCFTDGSQNDRYTRASFYNQLTGESNSLPLGTLCSVFQAEMYAIMQCVRSHDLCHWRSDSIAISVRLP